MRLEFEPGAMIHTPATQDARSDNFGEIDNNTLLKKGISAAQAGDRDLARKLLKEVVSGDPASSDAWMWLASIAEYPEELLACLDHVLAMDPQNVRAAEWQVATRSLMAKTFVDRGVSASRSGDNVRAREFFDQALAHDRECEMAWSWKSTLSDDESDKVEFLRRVTSINPGNAEASSELDAIIQGRVVRRLDAAKSAAAAGRNDEALSLIEQVLDTDGNNLEAWTLRSHLGADLGDKLNCLEKILAIDPDNAAARASYDFLSSAVEVEASSHEAAIHEESVAEVSAALEVTVEPAFEATPDLPVEANEPEGRAFDPFATIASIPVSEISPAMESQPADFAPVTEAAEADEGSWDNHLETNDEIELSDQMVPTFANDGESWAPEEEIAYEVEQEEPLYEVAAEYCLADEDGLSPAAVHIAEDRQLVGEYCPEPIEVESYETENEHSALVPDENAVAHVFEQAQTAYEEGPSLAHVTSSQSPLDGAGMPCPFCAQNNDRAAFACADCRAALTLSDIEALFSNSQCDRKAVQGAVTEMEAEWNLRDFSADELISLGLGHLNLGNYAAGIKYLQEASRAAPNDVILSGQINGLIIRLDESRRQNELDQSRPKGRTILVVDDSATVRKLISGKLEKSGHNVVCAEDGVEALARISQEIPDLVLLDITMPRMDGYEVCRQIRSNPDTKDVPVVMISGKDGFFDKVRGRMAGTTAYITKPFGPETLMKALETYLVESGEKTDGLVDEFESQVAV